ncbi:MAG: DUF1566 domain-containing protein [Bacteroidales bacterium]|jgi:hypothetical protein|nr:DUF1566 domain-containing protein [Bacteroidales bacterium]
MKTLYHFLFIVVLMHLLYNMPAVGQVSINNDGSAPDSSAMLEIKSENKGLLLPRIDYNNRPLNATTGLLIYVTANGPFGNGLYIFDGVGWLKINTSTYYLGQHVGGGVVFYLDPSGQHGLIASETDLPDYYLYGCDTDTIPGANGTALGTGATNTAAILAVCPTPGIAASVCDTLTTGGFTDWFLPSVDELDSVYVHQSIIGGFAPFWYWSSTEQSIPGAWIVEFDIEPPNVGWTSKNSYLNVRCIRKF